VQWLTEEAFASTLELHEAGEHERDAEQARRQTAVQRSLDRRQQVLNQLTEQAA
jgi:hypothetical protein